MCLNEGLIGLASWIGGLGNEPGLGGTPDSSPDEGDEPERETTTERYSLSLCARYEGLELCACVQHSELCSISSTLLKRKDRTHEGPRKLSGPLAPKQTTEV